jgi:hypothetical protein
MSADQQDGDYFNSLERTQMTACVRLAKALAQSRVNVAVIYVPGDAPYITVSHVPELQVCADHQGKYDVWLQQRTGLNIVKPDLSFEEAVAALSRQPDRPQ